MYDVIVVGARVAGSPAALLLARMGYRTLLVDRVTFPSDTLSTHVIHAPGVAALHRWGLLDEVVATGCPPIESYTFDFGPVALQGTTRPVEGISTAFAPRRIVVDAILLEAAARAGAEVREGFNIDDVLIDDGRVVGVRHGGTVERARLVIGADGRGSHVARAVGAPTYSSRPKLQYGFYTYFSDLAVDGLQTYVRPGRGFGIAPTNHGLTMVVAGWPYAEAKTYKADVEANVMATLRLVPSVAARLGRARREAPFLGGAVPGFFRKPYGPGWALIGDAGCTKDPITAQGISDAFLDAQRCASAVDAWLSGACGFDAAMSAWHHERDTRLLPMYEFTAQMATLEPPPPQMQQLFAALQGNQKAMDEFVSVVAGVVSPATFFAEDNLARLFAEARRPWLPAERRPG